MKFFALLTLALTTQVALADIVNSNYEKRHQNIIEGAIVNKCGYFKDLTEVASESETIRVDNGIQDVKFETTLSGLKRLDQNIFDTYEIKVRSTLTDAYDHSSGNWGIYSVEAVNCTQL